MSESMLSLRGFWKRHRRKLFFTFGTLGGGYVLYKLYDAHRTRFAELESKLEGVRVVDELVKSQLQNHFESIQRISDTTTLPYAVHYLRSQIADYLDVSHLTEKLKQGKEQPSILTPKVKAELWEMLKVLSFTRLTTSVWSMMVICLYVRAQVNILGRHLYVDIARGSENSQLQEEVDSFSRHGQQDFLATADYLSTYGIRTLIKNMQRAATEVLKDKHLKDSFSMEKLKEMIIHILEMFMGMDEPHYWISYLIPENITAYRQMLSLSCIGFEDSSVQMNANNLEQLVLEMRAVLSSPEFSRIMHLLLNKLVDSLVEDISAELNGANSSSGTFPLATLLPRVTHMAPQMLKEPSANKFIQIIQNSPEVELFYTILYTNTPPLIS